MFRKNAKFKICFMISAVMIFTPGCSKNKDSYKIETPKFSQIVVGEKIGKNMNVYSLDNGKLMNKQSIKDLSQIKDMKYNSDKGIYVFLNIKSKGTALNNNSIEILKNNKKIELDDFYSASDIKLSKDGQKLAYRSFLKDSLSSAEDLKIYDINLKKHLKIKSRVIVSGNLYQWLNNNEIVYYGIIPEKKEFPKMYKYNFDTNKEEVYLDNIKGYCTNFVLLNEDVLYICSRNDESYMIYYNKKNEKNKIISSNIDKIYEGILDKNNNFYLVARNKLEEKTYLYSISNEDKSLNRLTYDFPANIDIKAGIGEDKKGNIYFAGYDNSNENSFKNQIYVYKKENNSVEIVSHNKSLYNIFQNKSVQ